MPLRIAENTEGARTGWRRVVAETWQRSLRFELKFKRDEDELDFSGAVGVVTGLEPSPLAAEIEQLLTIDGEISFAIETVEGQPLARGRAAHMPMALRDFFLPVASGLTALQPHAAEHLLMPDLREVTMGEIRKLRRLVSLYEGTPEHGTWSTASLTAPEDPADASTLLQQDLPRWLDEGLTPILVETPTVVLGDRSYLIDHPIAVIRRSIQLAPGTDLDALGPGDIIHFVPGDDDSVTTAPVAEWTLKSV